jgi:hypothetical protein
MNLEAAVAIAMVGMLFAGPAAAQPRIGYVGATLGAHHESSDWAGGGDALSGGIVGGAWLTNSIGVEFDLSRPHATFTHEYEGFSTSFAPLGSSREEIERLAVYSRFTHQRTVRWSLSVGMVYQKRVHPRWSPRLFVGVTNRFVEERDRFTPLRYPDGVDPQRLASVRATDHAFERTLGAFSGGVGVVFAATRHLSVAPDVRFDYGSIGDEINNGARTSVRVLWLF